MLTSEEGVRLGDPVDKKARVICLHGFPGHPTDWDFLAHDTDRDFLSVPMPWLAHIPEWTLNFDNVVAYCRTILDEHMAKPTHVVGHDIGALVLWKLSQGETNRNLASMSILSCPHPQAYLEFTGSPDYKTRTGYIDNLLRDPTSYVSPFVQSGERGSDQIAAHLKDTDFTRISTLYSGIVSGGQRSISTDPVGIDVPIALIAGRDDFVLGPHTMERSAELVAGPVKTMFLDSDSHFPHLTNPETVNTFLEEFWNATGH
ncbi:MAG: alpha/beta hydrolase [Paracoccaceae bacterium]|nr:alpha/beta hydrolase [Paracoccaceae bacterium]